MSDLDNLRWVKSSRSQPTTNDCVEVARQGDRLLVRDIAGDTVSYTESEWRAFTDGVQAGELRWESLA